MPPCAEGLRGVILDPFASGLALIIAGLFFAHRMWDMHLLTMGDFYARTYGPKTERLSSIVQAAGYFPWIAAQYVALAAVLREAFGWPTPVGITVAVQPSYHRFVVEPVTARHNIRNQTLRNMSDELLDGFYESASMQMVSASMTGEIALVFPDGGPAPSARVEVRKAGASGLEEIIWSLVDLTKGERFGSTENLHELTKSVYSFNKAENHTIMPGQKIGIVVYRFWDITRKDAMFLGTDDEWAQKRQELFGDKGKPCVYTGEILRVSEDSKTFEHNINTFKGCSGAIIFLLDKNQPGDLATEAAQDGSLFGAAIGVHVGAPPDIITGANVNIGFAL